MSPVLLFHYLLALSAGGVVLGLAAITLRVLYVWLFGPTTEKPSR